MPDIAQLRDEIERETPKWLASISPATLGRKDMSEWLEGKNRYDNSVPGWHGYIYGELIRRYALGVLTLDPSRPTLSELAALAYKANFQPFGIFAAKPNKLKATLPPFEAFGFHLALLIAAGWREEAELVARLYFRAFDRIGGHAVYSLPWFMLDLCRDWLRARVDLRDGDRKGDLLDGWSGLFKHWREPDPSAFKTVLDAAADYHLAESRAHVEIGRDDDPNYVSDHFEIEPSEYWLFPVELFAVLRLREGERLPNPELSHPLFTHTPLGHLPEPAPKVADRFLDEVDAKFRSVFPRTPTLADLPALRAEQA